MIVKKKLRFSKHRHNVKKTESKEHKKNHCVPLKVIDIAYRFNALHVVGRQVNCVELADMQLKTRLQIKKKTFKNLVSLR